MFTSNNAQNRSRPESTETKDINSPPHGTGYSQPISLINQDAMAAEEIIEQEEIDNVYIDPD